MKILIYTISICFFLSITQFSKDLNASCGTVADFSSIEFLNQTRELRQQMASGFAKKQWETLHYPIQIFIGRKSNGSGGTDLNEILDEIKKTNNIFHNAGMQFYVCGEVIYIDEDELYDFTTMYDFSLNEMDQAGKINLYIFNSASTNEGPVCGYTFFPGSFSGGDRIIMSKNCLNDGFVLAHEIGHFFTLWHTHGKYNQGTGTDELVNGSNCNTSGDDLCDTPADPNLSNRVNTNCVYTGNLTDQNGDMYEPNPFNIMSYARKGCRNFLTSDQYDRARASAFIDRDYFCCGEPIADFEFTQTNNHFVFTNLSENYYELTWKFGDGNQIKSNDSIVLYSYSNTGSFTLQLIAESYCGENSISTNISVTDIVSANFDNAIDDKAIFEVITLNEPPLLKAVLPIDGKISLEIFDITGRQLYQTSEEFYSKGTHYLEPLKPEILNNNSVFFLRISYNDKTYFKKMLN